MYDIFDVIHVFLNAEIVELNLLPCPFCGSPASLYVDDSGDYNIGYNVNCTECAANVCGGWCSYRSRKIEHKIIQLDACRDWNKRK